MMVEETRIGETDLGIRNVTLHAQPLDPDFLSWIFSGRKSLYFGPRTSDLETRHPPSYPISKDLHDHGNTKGTRDPAILVDTDGQRHAPWLCSKTALLLRIGKTRYGPRSRYA